MADDSPGGAVIRGRRAAVGFILVTVWLDVLSLGVVIPVYAPLIQQFQHGDDASAARWMGIFSTVWALSQFFGAPLLGALSDRFGRRPVLLCGLGIYCVAGLAAALAPEVHSLIAARLFQAVGGCAGLVLGRSIVRDTAEPQEATRRLALMNLMVTVGPSLAPQ